MELVKTVMPSPVGRLVLVAAPTGLRAVLWPREDGSRVRLATLDAIPSSPTHPILVEAVRQLGLYFDGAASRFTVPLVMVGTPFQRAVWQALTGIPHGATRTYGEVAASLGCPAASRAVGAANGRNPLSIIVPCHRLVGAGGGLHGFAGGLAGKRWLLDLEAGRRDPATAAAAA